MSATPLSPAPLSPSGERPRVATDTPLPMAFSGRSPTADAPSRAERALTATDTPLPAALRAPSPSRRGDP